MNNPKELLCKFYDAIRAARSQYVNQCMEIEFTDYGSVLVAVELCCESMIDEISKLAPTNGRK